MSSIKRIRSENELSQIEQSRLDCQTLAVKSSLSLSSIPKEIWANHILSYLTFQDKRKCFRMTNKWFEKIVTLKVLQYTESIRIVSIDDYTFGRKLLVFNITS
jgi:hypothetical protein